MSDAGCLAWPFFDDEHRGYAREIARWASEVLPGLGVGEDESPDAVCADVARLVAGMGKAGLLRVCAPRAYGGLREGLDVRSLCLARETLARSSGLADFALAMQGLGSAPITLYGREDQKRAFLPRVVAGTAIAAFALSEPEAGSDAAALTATAVRDGDSWRLDGVKTWISNGGLASYYVVFARSGEQPGAKGISAFIVDADAPGVDASERIEVIAPHPLATLRLTGCRVPGDRLLGQPGEGFKIAMGTLDAFRSGNAEILVATDIAARGIDVDGIRMVVNYDVPNDPETYVHRVGRTARAGARGLALTLLSPDEWLMMADIEKLVGQVFPREIIPGFEPSVAPLQPKQAAAEVKRPSLTIRGRTGATRRRR